MAKEFLILIQLLMIIFLAACQREQTPVINPESPHAIDSSDSFWSIKKSGGDATSLDEAPTSHSFGYPLPSLTEDELELHQLGDANFNRHFTDDVNGSHSGLGPVYNNSSCVACHNSDGRGSLPLGLSEKRWTQVGVNEAIFLRMSIENEAISSAPKSKENNYGAPVAVPGFSTQLFHVGVFGLRGVNSSAGQAELWIRLEKSIFTYPDGGVVELSKPVFEVRNPFDQNSSDESRKTTSRLFQKDVCWSPRMGVPVFGLGLLEAIPDQDLLKNAEIDRSSEGVHGVPNQVWDPIKELHGKSDPMSIGRFGLKGSTASVEHQSMAALNGDMGVTNPLFPTESIFETPLFEVFKRLKTWLFFDEPKAEADLTTMKSLVFYARTLAVPPRRNVENLDVIRGAKLFSEARCVSCHVPSWQTGVSSVRALSFQKIYPFTDLLLHDMGEGLADNRQDFLASGRQWKTPPLWGIGLTKVVNPRAGFLHDGRARTLEEAILWHDGEANHSRSHFVRFTKSERLQLISFLNSL